VGVGSRGAFCGRDDDLVGWFVCVPCFPTSLSDRTACVDELRLPRELVEEVTAAGLRLREVQLLSAEGVLESTDVLYVTRVQKERFASAEEYDRLKHFYVITRDTLSRCKERMIVMHPLPRVGEIAEEVDADPRAAYFTQMRCGLIVRMALLALVCGRSPADISAAASVATAGSAK